MRVYDIIALKEELDIRPTATLGADGKPMGYEVFDTDRPRQPIQRFTGPDAEGKAEEWRDTERARRGDRRPDPSRPDRPDDRRPTGARAKYEEYGRKWDNFMKNSRYIRFGARYLGINISMYATLREELGKIYTAYYVDKSISEEEYEKRAKALFGSFVATVLYPVIVQALKVGGKLLLAGIRTLNVATTAASAVAGPPGLAVGVLKFVLVEGAAWGVVYLLSTSESVRDVVADWLVRGFSGEFMAEFSNISKGAMQAVGSAVGSDTIYNASKDVERVVNLSPEELRDLAVGNGTKIKVDKTDPQSRSGSGSSATPPRQSGRPSGSPAMSLD